MPRLMHLFQQNFYSACMLTEARSSLCCDFPFQSLYFLLRKCLTLFHVPPPADMPGVSEVFSFSCLPLSLSLRKKEQPGPC